MRKDIFCESGMHNIFVIAIIALIFGTVLYCILVKLENDRGDLYEMTISRKIIFLYNVGDHIVCSFLWYPNKKMYENFCLYSSGSNTLMKGK